MRAWHESASDKVVEALTGRQEYVFRRTKEEHIGRSSKDGGRERD